MKLLVFLVICGFATTATSQQVECPTILPRGAWGGIPPRHVPVLPIRPAPFVIIHPTHRYINEFCESTPVCAAKLRDIQSFQVLASGWPEISYHFIFTAESIFYAGRGWGRMGENVGAYNNQAINIGFLGYEFFPNQNTTNLVNQLIECGIAQGHLAADVRVVAQCQVTGIVACDTSSLYDWISENPRFEPNPQPL